MVEEPRSKCVPLRDLRYTQCTIRPTFGDRTNHQGEPLTNLVDALMRADIQSPYELVLDVVKFHGELYTLSNRRLWCLQEYYSRQLHQSGVPLVKVRILPLITHDPDFDRDDGDPFIVINRFFEKFTTTNGGASIEMIA